MAFIDLDNIISNLKTYKSNFVNQTSLAFSRLTPQNIIRLVIIVGAYCLLRPYLVKLGAKFQEKDHERTMNMEEAEKLRRAEGMGLKGRVEIPEDTESEGEGDGAVTGSGADWGKKARRRQRKVVRQLIEADERRRREEEEAASDKEIEDLLLTG